jgi:hypothetical protein
MAQVEREPARGPSAADFWAFTADRSIVISSTFGSLSETAADCDLARRPRYGHLFPGTPDAKPDMEAAGTCKADKNAQNATDGPNVLRINGLRGNLRNVAGRKGNEVAGTRTQDLRIKSPLLYRLSYNL